MTTDASPFSPIGRREFVQLCAGSLALAASGCRRRDAGTALRRGTVIMAIPKMRDILPDEFELDFLPFSRLAEWDEVCALVNVAGGRDTAAAIPGASLLIFSDMGHDLPQPLWPTLAGAIAGHTKAN